MFVVGITANHYWLDGLVAAALLAAAMTIARPIHTRTSLPQVAATTPDHEHKLAA